MLTERHIVVDDCCFCPNCKFPSNSSYMRKILESENACPMCNIALDLNDVQLVNNINNDIFFITQWNFVFLLDY